MPTWNSPFRDGLHVLPPAPPSKLHVLAHVDSSAGDPPMSWAVIFLIVAAMIVIAQKLGLLTKRSGKSKIEWPVFPRKVLSPVEQTFYYRLRQTFPDHVILAQVAVSQLVGVKQGKDFNAIFNRFNRLVADFVLVSKDFTVTGVIELDDRSHDHPRRQDADRRKAAVLSAAGIPLHRVNVNPLPDEGDLRRLVGADHPTIRV